MAELGGQLTPSVKGGGQGYISDPSPIIRDIDLVARDGCFSQALRSAFFYLKRTEMQDFVQNFLRGCHPRTATGGRGPPSFPYQPAVFSDSSNIFDAPRPLFPAADGHLHKTAGSAWNVMYGNAAGRMLLTLLRLQQWTRPGRSH